MKGQELQQKEQMHFQECKTNELQEQLKHSKTKAVTEILFRNFAAIWGTKWMSSISDCNYDNLVDLWAEEIASLTNEELNKGFSTCKVIYKFPPSLHEFLFAAYDFVDDTEAFMMASKNSTNTLIDELDNSLCKHRVLITARRLSIEIFNKINNYSISQQKKEFLDIYHDVINDFLKNRNEKSEHQIIMETNI